jgi:hypothetical protein
MCKSLLRWIALLALFSIYGESNAQSSNDLEQLLANGYQISGTGDDFGGMPFVWLHKDSILMRCSVLGQNRPLLCNPVYVSKDVHTALNDGYLIQDFTEIGGKNMTLKKGDLLLRCYEVMGGTPLTCPRR